MNCRIAIPATMTNSFKAGPNARTKDERAPAIAGAAASTAEKTPINAAWIAGAAAAMIADAPAIPDAIATSPAPIAGPAADATANKAVTTTARAVNAARMPMMTAPRMPIANARAIRPGAAPTARYPAAIRIPSPIPIAQRPLLRASQLNPAAFDSAEVNIPRAKLSRVSDAIPTIAPWAANATATMVATTSSSLPIELRISPQLWSAICTIAPTAMFIAIAVRIKAPAPTIAVAGIRFAIATRSRITADKPTIPWNSLFMSM